MRGEPGIPTAATTNVPGVVLPEARSVTGLVRKAGPRKARRHPYASVRRALRCVAVDKGERYPWRTAMDPWSVLLVELLLQRTSRHHVRAVYKSIRASASSPGALANLSDPALDALTASLGLRKRVHLLRRLARALVERHDGDVPKSRQELLALPGVGPYHTVSPVVKVASTSPGSNWSARLARATGRRRRATNSTVRFAATRPGIPDLP